MGAPSVDQKARRLVRGRPMRSRRPRGGGGKRRPELPPVATSPPNTVGSTSPWHKNDFGSGVYYAAAPPTAAWQLARTDSMHRHGMDVISSAHHPRQLACARSQHDNGAPPLSLKRRKLSVSDSPSSRRSTSGQMLSPEMVASLAKPPPPICPTVAKMECNVLDDEAAATTRRSIDVPGEASDAPGDGEEPRNSTQVVTGITYEGREARWPSRSPRDRRPRQLSSSPPSERRPAAAANPPSGVLAVAVDPSSSLGNFVGTSPHALRVSIPGFDLASAQAAHQSAHALHAHASKFPLVLRNVSVVFERVDSPGRSEWDPKERRRTFEGNTEFEDGRATTSSPYSSFSNNCDFSDVDELGDNGDSASSTSSSSHVSSLHVAMPPSSPRQEPTSSSSDDKRGDGPPAAAAATQSASASSSSSRATSGRKQCPLPGGPVPDEAANDPATSTSPRRPRTASSSSHREQCGDSDASGFDLALRQLALLCDQQTPSASPKEEEAPSSNRADSSPARGSAAVECQRPTTQHEQACASTATATTTTAAGSRPGTSSSASDSSALTTSKSDSPSLARSLRRIMSAAASRASRSRSRSRSRSQSRSYSQSRLHTPRGRVHQVHSSDANVSLSSGQLQAGSGANAHLVSQACSDPDAPPRCPVAATTDAAPPTRVRSATDSPTARSHPAVDAASSCVPSSRHTDAALTRGTTRRDFGVASPFSTSGSGVNAPPGNPMELFRMPPPYAHSVAAAAAAGFVPGGGMAPHAMDSANVPRAFMFWPLPSSPMSMSNNVGANAEYRAALLKHFSAAQNAERDMKNEMAQAAASVVDPSGAYARPMPVLTVLNPVLAPHLLSQDGAGGGANQVMFPSNASLPAQVSTSSMTPLPKVNIASASHPVAVGAPTAKVATSHSQLPSACADEPDTPTGHRAPPSPVDAPRCDDRALWDAAGGSGSGSEKRLPSECGSAGVDEPFLAHRAPPSLWGWSEKRLQNPVVDPTKPHNCEYCLIARFARKIDLEIHKRDTHATKERPYSCWQCGKTFARKQNRNTHLMTHSGRRPFECGKCFKRFSRRSNLVRHQKVHEAPAAASGTAAEVPAAEVPAAEGKFLPDRERCTSSDRQAQEVDRHEDADRQAPVADGRATADRQAQTPRHPTDSTPTSPR